MFESHSITPPYWNASLSVSMFCSEPGGGALALAHSVGIVVSPTLLLSSSAPARAPISQSAVVNEQITSLLTVATRFKVLWCLSLNLVTLPPDKHAVLDSSRFPSTSVI